MPRRRRLPSQPLWLLGVGLVAALGSLSLARFDAAPPGPLILESDFDGPEGAPPPAPWGHDIGGGGWGNDELQTYTDRPDNAALDGQGNLRITARAERFTGPDGITREYTSARVTTEEAFTFTHGRVEVRLSTPHGIGLWPAMWLLGDIPAEDDWRTAGEIDVLEVFGSDPRHHATVHGFSDEPRGWSRRGSTSDLIDLTTGFHTYVLDWEPDRVRVSVDGSEVLDVSRSDLDEDETWSVDKPMYLLINLAVGGRPVGPPDETTPFPASILVDHIRVWGMEVSDV